MVYFRTERLMFRDWQESDKDIFAKMNADPIGMRYFLTILDKPSSDALFDRITRELRERPYGLWAVEHREDHHFLGFIGLHYTDFPADFTPCVEVGWRLRRDYWGQGLATEGAKAVLDYARRHLDLREIYSFTAELNIPSQRVMQKIGMQLVGEFLHPQIDEKHDLALHVLYHTQL